MNKQHQGLNFIVKRPCHDTECQIPCNAMCSRDFHPLSITNRNHAVAFPRSSNKLICFYIRMKNNIFSLLMQLYSKAEHYHIMNNAKDNDQEIWSFLLLNTGLSSPLISSQSLFHSLLLLLSGFLEGFGWVFLWGLFLLFFPFPKIFFSQGCSGLLVFFVWHLQC